jgi:hypothetical protein
MVVRARCDYFRNGSITLVPLHVSDWNSVTLVEGTPGEPLMSKTQDATLLLEACFSARTRRALVYPEQLTSRFFDLSSGEAGEVLEKLRRFGVRLGIVCVPGTVVFSSRFHEILSDDLQVFDTRDTACEWLGR